jgi:hypothetical protein
MDLIVPFILKFPVLRVSLRFRGPPPKQWLSHRVLMGGVLIRTSDEELAPHFGLFYCSLGLSVMQ